MKKFVCISLIMIFALLNNVITKEILEFAADEDMPGIFNLVNNG